jgi:transcription termination factor Rho
MELKEKSVAELRNIAKEFNILNISKLKKSELIVAIEEAINSKEEVNTEKQKSERE